MSRSSTVKKVQTLSRGASFAGLDYHKKKTHITFGDSRGNVTAHCHLHNDKETFRAIFKDHPHVVCAVESCRGYEWLLDFLKEDLGLVVYLVNTLQAKLITQSKCKTDKLDSKALMQLLAKGYLPTCYQPSPEERRIRERLRWRAHLVRNATRMKVRLHSYIDKENFASILPDPFSKSGREALRQLPFSNHRKALVEEHLEILEYFEALVKKEDRWVKDSVKQSPSAKLLLTVPGIGDLSALILCAEIGDYSRFRTSGQLASYFGVVPRISSSAENRHVGPITKTGSRLVRSIIIQCAWRAISTSVPLRIHFNSVSKRCGRNGAIVSVARKLIKIAFRVLRDQKPFNADLVGSNESA
jgi:transposase